MPARTLGVASLRKTKTSERVNEKTKSGERMNEKTNTKQKSYGAMRSSSSSSYSLFARLYHNLNISLIANVGYNAVRFPRAGIRGGNANNGSNDGLGYVNVNNAVGNANANNGGRLSAFLYRMFYSRNDALYSHHRTVGGLMFRLGVSKFSNEEAESSRITMQTVGGL